LRLAPRWVNGAHAHFRIAIVVTMAADPIHQLRTFVAIAEAGSMVGGARARRLSPAAVTRGLAALEARLGVKLILRTTRTLRLTEVGEQFLEDVRRTLSALDAAEAAVTGKHVRVEGLLSITAPELFGERHVAPLLFEFLDRHPGVTARVLFTNRVASLVEEGIDVALRIAHLPDSRLTALPVGALRAVLVAAPSYLSRHGTPQRPADLSRHRAVGLTVDGQGQMAWGFKGKRSKSVVIEDRLVVNTNAVKVAAAVAGLGVARALAYQVSDEVRDGRLQIVLAPHEPPPVPVHLVYPAGRAASAKVREFLRFAAARLRALPVLRGKGLEPPRRRPGR
jgi:DNA-binding transcriptional LysR family regulator